MNILTLESSSLSASVCITEDTKLLAQSFQNCGLTHSATLLPMIDHIMTSAQMTLADIDEKVMGSDHCPVILELKGME